MSHAFFYVKCGIKMFFFHDQHFKIQNIMISFGIRTTMRFGITLLDNLAFPLFSQFRSSIVYLPKNTNQFCFSVTPRAFEMFSSVRICLIHLLPYLKMEAYNYGTYEDLTDASSNLLHTADLFLHAIGTQMSRGSPLLVETKLLRY